MSTYVSYDKDDPESFVRVQHSLCECGHQLYQHGNIFGFTSEYVGSHLIVSQCVMCKNCDEFHPKKEKNGSTKV